MGKSMSQSHAQIFHRLVKNLYWAEDNEKKVKKKKVLTQETHPKSNIGDMGKAFAFGKNIGKRRQKTFGLSESSTFSTSSTTDHDHINNSNESNNKKNSVVDSRKQMFQRQNSKDDMTLNLSTKSLTSEKSLTIHEKEEEDLEEEEKRDNDDHDEYIEEDIGSTLDESKAQHSSIKNNHTRPKTTNQDLPNREIVGVSDPYVVISHLGKKKKTSVIESTCNPIWKTNVFEYNITGYPNQTRFRLTVKDWNV
ncbi:timeless family protein [Reticulomyxa filosa]|uniref:Timeless family protein n=1 Tax=Reticulomyxa filosa TaxID=46433 RepID=X6PDN5_RETFI|nr:timeless family protein [Reticulomyxa filosa]|eukprot:ETO35777.1 timeless family protein [Reticulomyxa filosa]